MIATTAPRTHRWLVDIVDATDPTLCGGKAVGLAMLKRIGVSVPRAVCLTTDFYRHWLDVSGFGPRLTELVATAGDADVRRKILEQIRCEVEATPLSADAEAALRQGIGRVTLGRDGDVLSVRCAPSSRPSRRAGLPCGRRRRGRIASASASLTPRRRWRSSSSVTWPRSAPASPSLPIP
ncbi:MAG: hypothetical protein DME13_12520 [Candidatus Rokuibacteriota bacterium]|nr:MAG: hypothetical protein DME13_12520 [Candidatus Rokubacteria bacterium]